MLEVGVNTYVTITEADDYIESNFGEYDDLAVIWGVLSNREKERYLRASLGQIEALVIPGRPLDRDQPLQFPRCGVFRSGIIPQEVKDAQVENAVEILNSECKARADEQMKTLGTLGVIKNTKYNKREMGEIGLGSTLTGEEKKGALESKAAEELLRPWY